MTSETGHRAATVATVAWQLPRLLGVITGSAEGQLTLAKAAWDFTRTRAVERYQSSKYVI